MRTDEGVSQRPFLRHYSLHGKCFVEIQMAYISATNSGIGEPNLSIEICS